MGEVERTAGGARRSPAGPSRQRALSAASAGLLLLLLPVAVLSVAGAAASPGTELDSARSQLAVLPAAALLVAAAGAGWVVQLRRAAGHPGAAHPALGRLAVLLGGCAAAVPLVQAASGREPGWPLTATGAVGVLLALLAVAAHRPRAAVHVAVVVAVTLFGTAAYRDRPQDVPHGPPPVPSPGRVPVAPGDLPPPPR